MSRNGHIFVKTSPAAKCVKIEGSREHAAPVKRNRPEILEAFKIDFRHYFDDVIDAQQRVYKTLSSCRLFPEKPFFACGKQHAKTAVLEVAEASHPEAPKAAQSLLDPES